MLPVPGVPHNTPTEVTFAEYVVRLLAVKVPPETVQVYPVPVTAPIEYVCVLAGQTVNGPLEKVAGPG